MEVSSLERRDWHFGRALSGLPMKMVVQGSFSTLSAGNTLPRLEQQPGEANDNVARIIRKSRIWRERGDRIILMKPGSYEIIPVSKRGLTEQFLACDAAIVTRPNEFLLLRPGDCYPVIIIDPEHEQVALIHAGWREVEQDIVPRTIDLMRWISNKPATNMVALIGPGICANCLVHPERRQDRDAWSNFVREVSGGYAIDIKGLITKHLELSQVRIVHDMNLCTATPHHNTDPRFPSHYRALHNPNPDEPESRMAVIAGFRKASEPQRKRIVIRLI